MIMHFGKGRVRIQERGISGRTLDYCAILPKLEILFGMIYNYNCRVNSTNRQSKMSI
jgi:hypothetical protein